LPIFQSPCKNVTGVCANGAVSRPGSAWIARASRASTGDRTGSACHPASAATSGAGGSAAASSRAIFSVSKNFSRWAMVVNPPTVSVKPHNAAHSWARASMNPSCSAVLTAASPSGIRCSATSRINTEHTASSPSPSICMATTVWSMHAGTRSITPARQIR